MYNGETSVAQENLNRFLETAQELQVRGLQNTQENSSHKMISREQKTTDVAGFSAAERVFNPDK